ncbi:DUF2786 domain-containing protein [Sedimenticola hydrogenitrophicus]|uniref:DUF2786 domain-containing protein n=1 Tax=Sedimenticola hydrogenitrophicus TaxID=2967975 RepID=UPI0023AEB360
MNDNDKIIDKIKKCLALSASANEHEAEAALRQARKLMEAHNVTEMDVHAAQAEERRANAGAKNKPADWEAALASRIAVAFGCRLIFSGGYWSQPGEWVFIGCGTAPEIAHYAFTVLHRQAKRARNDHIKSRLKRCKPANKTRRADLFSTGWVSAVVGKIVSLAGSEQQTTAIDAYLAKRYESRETLAARNRNEGRRLRDHEWDDLSAGRQSGRQAELNRGVSGTEGRAALEGGK